MTTQLIQWINNFKRAGALTEAEAAQLKRQNADDTIRDLDTLACLLSERYFERWNAFRAEAQLVR